jgi:hypothetical protein
MLARIRNWFSREKTQDQDQDQAPPQDQQQHKEHTDDTRKEMCSTFFSSLVEGVKISMACLLSIFVPQYCEDTGTTCTLQQNFQDLTQFNVFVIFWNFFTLGFFIKLIYVINKREAYFISHLEESRTEPYNSFMENLAPYPKIINRVKEHNKRLRAWTHYTLSIFALNVLWSAILIFYYFYDGFRSVSTMLANVLLVSSRLYSLYSTSEDCTGYRPMALSSTKQSSLSYNVVDDAYKIVSEDGPKRYKLRISIDGAMGNPDAGKIKLRNRSRSMSSIPTG